MKPRFSLLFFLIALSLIGVSSCRPPVKSYAIGIDPSWYFSQLMGKEGNVSAFTEELLRSISTVERVHFKRMNKNWNNLLECLEDQDCQGVVTSLYPYIFYEGEYQFSDPFLQTGPVLIVRKDSTLETLDALKGKEVMVGSQANKALIIRNYPGTTVYNYNSIAEAFYNLIQNNVDAILIDVIPAKTFVQNLYFDQVKIISKPLNDQGLRLVTLHNEQQDLIKQFNAGLEKLRKNGVYQQLLEKWDLNAL